MSYHFSQALVEEYLEANSSDGELCALLKTMPMPELCLQVDRTTKRSKPSQSGTMFVLLTESRGEALLTWFRQDSRVSHSQSQGNKKENSISATYGLKQFVSFAKYDQNSFCWKTSQLSLLTNTWDKFSETWPRAGMIVDGIAYLRHPLAPLTRETDSGLLPTMMARKNLWPTPTVCGNYNRKGMSATSGNGLATVVGGKLNPRWVEWLMGYPIGWTSLDALETDRYQKWLEKHG